MKLRNIFKLSFNMLLHSKLRSWLTILGIFIGVASVIAIISLGEGLQQNVNAQIQGLGQDIIMISAGASRAFGPHDDGEDTTTANVKQLSDKDLQTLKLVPGVKYINGVISGRLEVTYKSESASLSLQGYDPAFFKEFVTTSLRSGRYLSQGDVNSIVIGDSIAQDVYTTKLDVGYLLAINGKSFRVVGILKPSSGFASTDNTIFMSTKDAREVLADSSTLKQDEFSSINVKVTDAKFVEEITINIEEALRNSHHVAKGKEDFSVISPVALQEQFDAITGGITLFLGIIAGVSLLVGGIGVANTMFTSVLEKTRDIGVMKAIGAKNSDILLIFLFNSGMLGLVGGLLGIMFAIAISLVVPLLGFRFGPPGTTIVMPINVELLVFGILFSVAIGMISGVLPAYRASKLKPVDALRHE